MSAYIYFFLKRKDDEKFTCLGCFSRSHEIYLALNSYVPFESITLLTDAIYGYGRENLQANIDDCKKIIKGYKKRFKILSKSSDFKEFEQYICEAETWIDETKEKLKWTKRALDRLNFIKELEKEDDVEIYVGVEIGNPTMQDII